MEKDDYHSSGEIPENSLLQTWGYNNDGQLGTGTAYNNWNENGTMYEAKFAEFSKFQITDIACGMSHSLAMTIDGKLWAWGQGSFGQLGIGTQINSPIPKHVSFFTEKSLNIVQFSGGTAHSMVLTTSGEIYGFGRQQQLGIGTNNWNANTTTPTLVSGLSAKHVVKISAKYDHSLALTSDGEIYWYGACAIGQQNTPQIVAIAKELDTDEKVVEISNGQSHDVCVTNKGRVFSWGEPIYCGQNVRRYDYSLPKNQPRLIKFSENIFVKKVVCGQYHTMLLTDNGEVWGFGNNYNGEANGGNSNGIAYKPKKVKFFKDSKIKIVQIAAGANFSMALSDKGEVYVYGVNSNGQCNQPTPNYQNNQVKKPSCVMKLANHKAVLIAAGGMHCMAMMSSRHVPDVVMDWVLVGNEKEKEKDNLKKTASKDLKSTKQ